MGFKMKGFPKQGGIAAKIQQLDDMIARAKKLGKKGTAQVLIDKKSKLDDQMRVAAAQAKQIEDDPGNTGPDPSKVSSGNGSVLFVEIMSTYNHFL